jgi:hypothetical protein
MAQVRKPKTKVVRNKTKVVPEPVMSDDHIIYDYSLISDSSFIKDFVEKSWTESYHNPNNEHFNIKYKLCNVIAELRYHIKQKQEKTQEIARKYGSYDQNTDNWMIPPESQQEFQNELNTLNNIRIQSDNLKINASDLVKASIWDRPPYNSLSLSNIEILSDIINYDFFEEETTNQS